MNIIQTWKDNNIPKQYIPFVNSVREHTKNWNYLFFNDKDIDNFFKLKATNYLAVYNSLPYKIQRIDFFRYVAIYYYGGVYLDLDILLEESIDELFKEPHICKFPIELDNIKDTIITQNNFYKLIGNYAFYAPAKHPFIKQIIDNITNKRLNLNDVNIAASTNNDPYTDVFVYCTTGPIMVTQSYIDFIDNDSNKINNKKSVELIIPEPFTPNSFGRFGTHCCYGSWK